MKPWRPYWKHLEEIEDALLKDAGPTPFGSLTSAPSWIEKLTFVQLNCCDHIFGQMIDGLKYGDRLPLQLFEGADIRWQMILRVACGLSFCQGHVGNRKEFDWSQSPEAIHKWLLIDFWYADAMHWAHIRFRSGGSKKAQLSRDINAEMWRLGRAGKLESN